MACGSRSKSRQAGIGFYCGYVPSLNFKKYCYCTHGTACNIFFKYHQRKCQLTVSNLGYNITLFYCHPSWCIHLSIAINTMGWFVLQHLLTEWWKALTSEWILPTLVRFCPLLGGLTILKTYKVRSFNHGRSRNREGRTIQSFLHVFQ